MPFTARGIVIALAAMLLFSFSSAPACATVFNLDTNQSVISISGSVLGATFSQQGSGSLTTHYSGTIEATVSGSSIQFDGGSAIAAFTNGTWQPMADGSAGSAPADYGATANQGIIVANAALRNILFDATSPAISIVGGQFDSHTLTFSFPSNAVSSLAYRVTGAISESGSKSLTGDATNNVSSLATLATNSGQQTLTIPVNATFHFTLLTSGDTVITVNGEFVAVTSPVTPLTIQGITVQTQMVTLQWQSAANQQFQVESSPDLVDWTTNAPNVTSSTSTYTWSGPVTNGTRFYRLQQ